MTTQATPSTSSRPRSLLDLPTEVLEEIVQMCAEQDKALSHREKLLRQQHKLSIVLKKELSTIHAPFGRSLNAVFMTCRLLCSLASTYLFLTLRTSRVVGQTTYRFYVAPKYIKRFQHLVIDSANSIENSYFLASLHSFTSLREITITRSARDAIFGADTQFNDLDSDPGIAAFAAKASTIRILHLVDFTAKEAIPFLWVFKSLSTLEMGPFDDAPVETVKEFALATPNLRSLKLNIGDMMDTELPSNTSADLWPPLESIEINILHDAGDSLDLDFIKDFRHSLVSLAIESPAKGGAHFSALTFTDDTRFPRLKSMSIIGGQQAAFAIFDNAQQSTFPSLTNLRLSYNDNYNDTFGADDRVLRQILEFPTLRYLEYSPPDQDLADVHESYLSKEAHARDIHVDLHNCPAVT